jgi:hypothetical protein
MSEDSTNPDHEDMLDEYDLSNGIRGKYAQRYAQGPNTVQPKSQAEPVARLSYLDSFGPEYFAELVNDLSQAGIRLESKPRAATAVASFEWLAPTAIALYLARPFVDAFLKRAADDVADPLYPKLKDALVSFAEKVFVGESKSIWKIQSGKEPILDPRGMFSIEVQIGDREVWKFIFNDDTRPVDYARQVSALLDVFASATALAAEEALHRRNAEEPSLPSPSRIVFFYDSEAHLWIGTDPVRDAIDNARSQGRM